MPVKKYSSFLLSRPLTAATMALPTTPRPLMPLFLRPPKYDSSASPSSQ